MEPFELALSQVNFEEEDLRKDGHDDLSSFSNTFSFESDFKDVDVATTGVPVLAKKVKDNPSVRSDGTHRSRSSLIDLVKVEGPKGKRKVSPNNIETETEVFNVGNSKDENLSRGQGSAFQAFTDTVDALALQESVIGNKDIAPASADEIAKVLAATQQRMNILSTSSSGDHLDTANSSFLGDSEETTPSMRDYSLELSAADQSPVHMPHRVPVEVIEEEEDSVLVATKEQGQYSIYMTDGKSPAQALYSAPNKASDQTLKPGSDLPHSVQELRTTVQQTEHEKSTEVVEVVSEGRQTPLSREGSVRSNQSESSYSSSGTKPHPGLAHNLHAVKPAPRQTEEVQSETQFIAIPHKDLIQIPAGQLTTTVEKSKSSWFSRSSSASTSVPMSASGSPGVKPTKHNESINSKNPTNKVGVHASVPENIHSQSDNSTDETDSSKVEGTGNASTSDLGNTEKVDDMNKSIAHTEPSYNSSEHHIAGTHSATVSINSAKTLSTVETKEVKVSRQKHSKQTLSSSVSLEEQKSSFQSSEDHSLSVESRSINDSLVDTSGFNVQNASTPVKNVISHKSDSNGPISNVQSDGAQDIQTEGSSQPTNDTVQHVEKQTHISHNLDVSTIIQEHTINQTYTQQPDISENSEFKMYMHLSEELASVMRQKAKLEGQLEVLEAEARQTLTDRAELQAQVAAMTEKLKVFENSQVGLVGDRNDMTADLDTLKQNRARLEQVVVDAHKLLVDKDAKIKTYDDDLRQAHEAQDKLQEQIKELKGSLVSRDNTVQDMKSKVAELYVEFQTCNQNKILAESEIKSLQSEIKSLSTGKEWYQDQLHAVQESKAQLQKELTTVKSNMISQSTTVQKLKVENIRVKQQLSETEQRSLREKEMLARHLEAIELDMVEREAAFSHMQQERKSMEVALQQKPDEIKADLADDLHKTQHDLRRKQAEAAGLEYEKSELLKRLTLSQESIAERDQVLEQTEKTCVDLEVSLKQRQLDITTKNDEILLLKQEMSALEVELSSAKEEKKTFDSTLKILKTDMGKVEQSFKHMKDELSEKNTQLEKLRAANLNLSEKAQIPSSLAEPNSHDPHIMTDNKQQTRTTSQVQEPSVIQDPALLNELDILRGEKVALLQQVALLKNDTSESLQALLSQKSILEEEKQQLGQKLESIISERQIMTAERMNLEQDLMVSKERILEMDLRLQRLMEEKHDLEVKALSVSTAVADVVPNGQEDAEEAVTKHLEENSSLREELANLQTNSHKQIARQKAKALKLGKDLERSLKEHREYQQSAESRFAEANEKLKFAEENCSKLSEELNKLHQKFSLDLDEKTQRLQQELQTYKSEMEALRGEKQVLEQKLKQQVSVYERTVEEYTTRITVVERELIESREYIEQRREIDTKTEQLALELEREKGRMAGIKSSHTVLKEHAGNLESQLAARESSGVVVTSQVSEQLQKAHQQIAELREDKECLEQTLQEDKQGTEELRKQLAKEKDAHAKLRRETDQLWIEHDQWRVDAEQKTEALTRLRTELEAIHGRELEVKLEVERAQTEQQALAMERDRLYREMEERKARDPFIEEQIKTLNWQLTERLSEIEGLQSAVSMTEERRDLEVSSLKHTLQSSTSELNSLREELAITKTDRSSLQAKIAELKNALKTMLEHTKMVLGPESPGPQGGVKSTPLPFDLSKIEGLLQDVSPVTAQSKPISFLKATLSGLRGEISILQQQATEHIEAIETSNKAWGVLEEQVKDLREICRNSAADRAASEKVMLESANFTTNTSVLPLPDSPAVHIPNIDLGGHGDSVGKSQDRKDGSPLSGAKDGATEDVSSTLKALQRIAQSEGAPVIYQQQTKSVTVTRKHSKSPPASSE